MPPKRQSPLESNPPSASSSDEESEEGSESEAEEEQQPKPTQSTKTSTPKPPPSDDEDDDEEDEEDEKEAQKTNEDEEDLETGSESESDNEPVKHMIAPRNAPVAAAAEVKPISSKPMSDIPKSKKPTTTTTTTTNTNASAAKAVAASGAKRSVEEEDEKNDKKRKKKKVSDIEDGGDEDTEKKAKGGGGEEKKPFQRVFGLEDEIILLKSLIDYKKDGHNAATDIAGFLDFVKDSLHINVDKAQLKNKIQRLEKKFRNNARRGTDGKDPVFAKPHELKSYELSKEIWSDQIGKDNGAEVSFVASGAGKRKRTVVKSNGVASPKRKVAKSVKSPKVEPIEEEEEEDNEKEEDGAGGLEYPHLSWSTQFLNNQVLPVPPQGLAGLVKKKGWGLIGTSNAEALDKKWKSLLIAETKTYLQRIDIVRDQTKLMLDVLESSDN